MSLMTDVLRENRRVYQALQDETSRMILTNRYLYSLTGDERYIRPIVQSLSEVRQLQGIEPGDRDYVFGVCADGQWLLTYWHRDWKGIADNNSDYWNKYLSGVSIIAPRDIPPDARVFVADGAHASEITDQLRGYGFSKDRIIDASSIVSYLKSQLVWKQYFEIPRSRAHDGGEVFVDGGCYNGFSTLRFIEWCEERYKKVYAFEPDAKNFPKARETLRDLIAAGKVELLPYGLWNKSERLRFASEGGHPGSHIGKGEDIIDAIALDEQPFCDDITFLKMDIEGAEYKALQGAEKLIRKNKPDLAICLYHKPEDVFEIPSLLLRYRPDYKFFVRHYTLGLGDTILYAV